MFGFSRCTVNVNGVQVATASCIRDIIITAINVAFIFAGSVSAFVIIFAGIRLVTSGGDPKQVEGARSAITYGVIGLVLVLLSVFIINIIGKITGVSCIQFGVNGPLGNCN